MDSPQTCVVASNDEIEVLYQRGPGRRLLITFNGLGIRADGERFSGQALATKLGMPAVGFMSKEGNWFPVASMRLLRGAVDRILSQYDQRLTYGFSMGGYAAIKHSRLLEATHVLAMSPQWSIHPEIAPWERRYENFRHYCDRDMEIRTEDCAGNIYLIFDSNDRDRHHAARITEQAAANLLRAPFVGHDTWRLFLSSPTMDQLFDAAFENNVPRLMQIVRERRRRLPDLESRTLWARTGRLLRTKRLSEALTAAHRAEQVERRMPGGSWVHAAILMEMDRPAEAERVLREEMARFPHIAWLPLHLARALEAQAKYLEAREVVMAMLNKQPKRKDIQHLRARLDQKVKDLSVAAR